MLDSGTDPTGIPNILLPAAAALLSLEAGAEFPIEVLAAGLPNAIPTPDGLPLVLGAVLPNEKPGTVDPKPKAVFSVVRPAVVNVGPAVAAAGVLPNRGGTALLPKVEPDVDAPATASAFKDQPMSRDVTLLLRNMVSMLCFFWRH